ncbi:unannotated protein [freshwater metagenome]|uniref:Unannotated protein n=1 Tax=freshwater metagenome TaxID=449393 RepID=A0A6J6N653_9ZZZZ|nr:EamA family transporter [Actinomycetota bacterium]MSZ06222.1 EamA family transporter [Actinomycetota bacterium]
MASLLALISSLLWGSADFEGGRLSKKHAPLAVLGVSQVLGLVFGLVLVVISYSSDNTIFSDVSFLIPGICAGFLGYCGLACLYAGLATGSMGVVSPISALSAVIPMTYSVMHGEKLSALTSLGIVFALAGAFCASGPELSAGVPLRPLLLAIGAACGFGTALTFISIGSQTNALLTMVTMRLATFVVTAGLAIKFKTLGGFATAEFPGLIFMGIADFLANLLLGVACNNGSVSVAMVLGSFYPIATAVLAFRFLKERLHFVQYIGIVLAVAGVALISAF